MAHADHQESPPVTVWPPPPTVEPPAAPAKKLCLFQQILLTVLVYLFVSALFFGGFLAANSLISWEEDKPFHESRVHLAVRSFLTPLMLWGTFAVINIIVRGSRRGGNKPAVLT